MSSVQPKSSQARQTAQDLSHVQNDTTQLHNDRQALAKDPTSVSSAKVLADTKLAEHDWENFKNSAAGLQNSSDSTDRAFAMQCYQTAVVGTPAQESLFGEQQGDLKYSLAVEQGQNDPLAGQIQQSTQSLIDQGNAVGLHWQQLVDQEGGNQKFQGVSGGTADPNQVSNRLG